MNALKPTLVRLFASMLVGACGSADATPRSAPVSTPSAAGGSAVESAPSSAGGPAANGSSGAPAGAAPVVACGSASCTAPMALPAVSTVTPMACCLDASKASCGYVVSGSCTPPAPDAPKCPAVMISLGKACCTANNICGIDATAFGMGCVDILPGAKTRCDGTRVASGGEAGSGGSAGSNAAASGSGASAGAAGR